MNVAFVSQEYPPSRHAYGIGAYTDETSRSLVRLGHKVTVLCSADDDLPHGETYKDGVRVIRIRNPELRSPSRLDDFIASASILEYRSRVAEVLDDLVASRQVDIVEFCGYRGESHLWRSAAHRRMPMVVRMHGYTGWADRNWREYVSASCRRLMTFETREMKGADCITLVANHLRPAMERRFPGRRIETIYNGVDSEMWRRLSSSAAPIDLGTNDILYVGNVSKLKGVMTLIEACESLRSVHGWTGRLVIYGRVGRQFEDAVKRRRRVCGPPNWIEFRGHVHRESLAAAYVGAGVCAFPSWLEPFGYTALEASACGGLVLGTKGTGMAETIVDGVTGFLVPPRDVGCLRSTLWHALHLDAASRAEMCRAAQERVRNTFDQDSISETLVKLYGSVIEDWQA